ncbi:MAG: DUF2914 domain-containing protein [Calditrichaeota bacterium]|nr:MAG: DUF2914 domain-containing protein [Calditrichota bacterium]
MRKLLPAVVALLLVSGVSRIFARGEEPQQKIVVSRMVICKNVVDREPVGEATAFADTTSRVYCFTHIKGAEQEVEITHRWYYGDSLMAEVSLPVRSASWRTWSSKKMVKSWAGKWRVEVVGPEGEVLRQAEFELQKTE